VVLLEKVSAGAGAAQGFMAFDYLVALLDGQHAYPRRGVLPIIWHFVVESLPEEEATSTGLTAYLRNDLAGAEHIWRILAGGSSTYSAEAAYNLGVLLYEQGKIEGARAAFQRAIEFGHPEAAPMATDSLRLIG